MKTLLKPLVVSIALASAMGGVATHVLAEETSAANNTDGVVSTGLSAKSYFTDELGNRRQPTEEEQAALGAEFQKALAKLAGKNKGKPNVQHHANGSTSATIALSKLEFLTVRENSDGSRTFGHGRLDENGNVTLPSPNNLPEE